MNAFSYIIEGQSNAGGAEVIANLPLDLVGKIKNGFIWNYNTYAWENLEAGVNGRPVGGRQAYFGCDIRLMKLLADYYKAPQFLYKYFHGGTPLYNDGSTICWSSGVSNQYYDQSNANYSLGLAKIPMKAPIKAYIWIQGEEDAKTTTAGNAYTANLVAYINAKRAYYGNSNLPFIIVKLSSKCAPAQKALVRAAQDNVALALKNVYTITTDSYQFQTANLHYNFDGYDAMATALFNLIITL